jgi:periplasmic divalent cation tolerance protein
MKEEYVQIVSTTETKKNAEKITQTLVDKRLAGCAQIIGPITSIYRWKGKVEKANEWLCLIKTKKELYISVENAIKQLHKYETPEIIVTPVTTGSKEYLKWLNNELKPKKN